MTTLYRVNFTPTQRNALVAWLLSGRPFRDPHVRTWAESALRRPRPSKRPGGDLVFGFASKELAERLAQELEIMRREPGFRSRDQSLVSMTQARIAAGLTVKVSGSPRARPRGPVHVDFDGGSYFIDRDGSISMKLDPEG